MLFYPQHLNGKAPLKNIFLFKLKPVIKSYFFNYTEKLRGRVII